jgi:hypothetical protein
VLNSRVRLATDTHQCPACLAYPGDVCVPRQDDDSPWMHKDRGDVYDLNLRIDAAAARGEFVLR